jgi:hypothetical protein
MQRQQILALTLGLCAINGLVSPYLVVVIGFAPIWMPSWLPVSLGIVVYLSNLITATTTLLLAGLPAAVAERLSPGLRDGNGVAWVWALAAFVLTVPGLLVAGLRLTAS